MQRGAGSLHFDVISQKPNNLSLLVYVAMQRGCSLLAFRRNYIACVSIPLCRHAKGCSLLAFRRNFTEAEQLVSLSLCRLAKGYSLLAVRRNYIARVSTTLCRHAKGGSLLAFRRNFTEAE
jgi:hypothetical protein